jgi:ion channel
MLTELSVAAGIVSLCVLLHVSGLLLMARALFSFQDRLVKTQHGIRYFVLLIVLFTINMLLHVMATIIWAVFYYSRALFSDFETSLYFSLASYTTIGYGDVVLTRSWRLLGAIEGISGVLLCGISTAFMFAVLNAIFRIWMENKQPAKD